MSIKKAYIWDVDGTLIDSYTSIVAGLSDLTAHFGLHPSPADIKRFVITTSVRDYEESLAKQLGLSPEELDEIYTRIDKSHENDPIEPIPHVQETLVRLKELGADHFIMTHRGPSTYTIMEELGLASLFRDIITSRNGFARKPAPDALLYLLEKYNLKPEEAAYVGDRTLDMEAAKNAGITGILYLEEGSFTKPSGAESVIVRDMRDIPSL